MLRFGWGLCVLLTISGCGGESKSVLSRVSGHVLMDGEPLSDAVVTFHNVGGGRGAFGVTDSDGRFTVDTSRTELGAEPGDYRVTVDKREDVGDEGPTFAQMQADLDAGRQPESKPPESAVPARYLDPHESGLQATVLPGGGNEFEFALKSP